jgi:hypothetical protein
MKNLIILTALIFFFLPDCESQNIQPAPPDKAVVYFVRPSSLGFAVNFTYFDSTKLVGKFNAPRYIRYECDPGRHLFWARSENKDFVEAEVDAGRIYFLEAIPHMGALKAAVELKPLDLMNQKELKKVFDLLEKKPSETFTALDIEMETQNMLDVIARGMEKYKEDKAKGVVFEHLDRNMYLNLQSQDTVK